MKKVIDPKNMQGRLPTTAYLANPYVPFQMERPAKYEARKALVRGTLYPGLDLPFMGKQNNNNLPVTPMSELQAMTFALNELALYLDTHRDDQEAFDLYQKYQEMCKKCTEEYVRNYGPISHKEKGDKNKYEWINDPWPWEYSKNKEG